MCGGFPFRGKGGAEDGEGCCDLEEIDLRLTINDLRLTIESGDTTPKVTTNLTRERNGNPMRQFD